MDFLPPGASQVTQRQWEAFEIRYLASNRKFGFGIEEKMGNYSTGVMRALKSPAFVSILENLTGISPLWPDGMIMGAGLHHTLPGGSLGAHTDFPHCLWSEFLTRTSAASAGAQDQFPGCVGIDTGQCTWYGTDPNCVVQEPQGSTPAAVCAAVSSLGHRPSEL